MADFTGKTLGQYQLERIIGRGGMAEVYSAHQVNLGREVAIKVIKPDLIEDIEFLDRFKREVKLLSKLEHPNIVPVIDGGEDAGVVYLVMRYIKGGGLHHRLRSGIMDLHLVAKMLIQIGSALTYAHTKADIVHRDMKPSNVLLDDTDNAYLTDFGIAKLLAGTTKLTASNTVLGTPAYMSPEQWRGEGLNATADIYSMGIMAYEMVTGRLPYEGDTSFTLMYKHFNEMPPSPRELVTTLPESLELVLLKSIAKDPNDRFQSAEEFGNAFRAAVEGRVVEVERPATKPINDPRPAPPLTWQTGEKNPTTIPLEIDTPPSTNHQISATLMTSANAKRDLPWLLVALAMFMIIVGIGIGVFLATQDNTPSQEVTISPTVAPTSTATTPPPNNPNQQGGPQAQGGPPTKDIALTDYNLRSMMPIDWPDPTAQDGYYKLFKDQNGRGPQIYVIQGSPERLVELNFYTADTIREDTTPRLALERIALEEHFPDGYTPPIQEPFFRYPTYHLSGFSTTKSRQADYYIIDLTEEGAEEMEWLVILATHPPDANYTFFQGDVLFPFMWNLSLNDQRIYTGQQGQSNGGQPQQGQPNGQPQQGQPNGQPQQGQNPQGGQPPQSPPEATEEATDIQTP